YENNSALANAYVDAFIYGQKWEDQVKFLDDLKTITKDELVAYVNDFYKDNYVVTYKRKGEDPNVVKVSNPGITPVNLNRGKQSEWVSNFYKMESESLQPKYVDYKSEIKAYNLENGIEVSHINNERNDLFDMNIIFDMGNDNDKNIGLAAGYMEYLGTDKYSPEDLKKEFYKLGVNYYVSTGGDRTYVGLNGLKENLPAGLELLEHLWSNAVADEEAYSKYVDKIAKGRQDNKTQKGSILYNGLMNYGKYGENSRLRNILQVTDLKEISPQELVNLIKDMKNFKQRIFYFGKDVDNAIAALNEKHVVETDRKDYPEAMAFLEKETGGNVYFVDYDMVQSEMLFLAKGKPFDPGNMAAARLFNTYFGSGLSSIVFQEIRESKSLAYSAWSSYSIPSKKEDSNYIMAYIGTQANKMPEAVDAMMDLMSNLPEAEEQFLAAKEATLKKLAAERITKSNIFWSYERLKRLGFDNDYRESMYNAIAGMTMEDLKSFFNENIRGENYNVMVIGNKNDVDMEALGKLGVIQEMDIDYLFNYEKPEAIKM
ncbi:MAG: insulinase family protein, partial [Bacteroidia bacterium]|nr:insulinase family protein [Bacteroidia bacterium]